MTTTIHETEKLMSKIVADLKMPENVVILYFLPSNKLYFPSNQLERRSRL